MNRFQFSLLFVALAFTLFTACSSHKMPTNEQVETLEYREVRGLFDVSEPQEKPDKMPMYPKGNNGLIKDIQGNVVYPETALEEGREGVVIVSFRVSDKGEVQKVGIDKGVSEDLNTAAKNVMETLHPFYPAETNGEPTAVDLKVLVTFNKPIENPDQFFTE